MGDNRSLCCSNVAPVTALLGFLLCAAPVKLDGRLTGEQNAGALAQTPAVTVEGEIATSDIVQAIEGIEELRTFFAKLARNDPNLYAAALWRGQQQAYAAISRRLNDLSAQGRVRIGTLAKEGAGRVRDGIILIDRRLGGLWPPDLVQNARRGGIGDWRYINLLSTALVQSLVRLEPVIGRDWFDKHLARSTVASDLPKDGRPLLAGFWYVKDRYLRISLLEAGTSDPELRRILSSRKVDLLSEARSLSAAMGRALGSGWGEWLWRDWQDYARQIDRFSSSRSWLAAVGRRPAKQSEALPEESPEAPLPRSKPDALGQAAAPAARTEATDEDRIALIRAELENSREEARRREARLTAEVGAARREAVDLGTKLDANHRIVAQIQEALDDEREARRLEVEALRAQLTAEQEAGRQAVDQMAQDLAAEVEKGRRVAGELRAQLATARETNRQELSKLQGELVAARDADRRASRAEEQLAAELEASREKLDLIRQQLTAELESDRREADERQARLAVELESSRLETAETVARLSAELAASQAEAAQLRGQLAELAGDRRPGRPPEAQPRPAEMAHGEDGNTAAWALGILVGLLGLAGLGAVAVRRRRAHPPIVQTAPAARQRLDSAVGQPFDPEEKVTPQLLVETLRRGEIPLFERRLAKLASLQAAQLQRILSGSGGENLAIVCRALGIDKLTFASIFLLSHTARSPEDKRRPRELSRVTAFYDRVADDSAREVLRQWQSDPTLPGVIGRPQSAAQ